MMTATATSHIYRVTINGLTYRVSAKSESEALITAKAYHQEYLSKRAYSLAARNPR